MKASKYPVLFSDDWLFVIDKPAGVLSHPNLDKKMESGGGGKGRSAFEGPYDFAERRFETPAGPLKLIHRLDKDTSGILVAAREGKAAENCRKIFEEGKVEKTYLALVLGRPFPLKGTWRDDILERKRDRGIRATAGSGRGVPAVLRYCVRKTFTRDALSLVEIQLITGRTHQIRVQFSSRRSPLAGDEVYGNFQENRKLRKSIGLYRLFLHAHKLAFAHPATGKHLELVSPLPPELDSSLTAAK
ncbi:MAG: RluA family pseudouridine synthase [Candidatus Omnitrophica bacterium]|nr:RluA family pseudouridine synthase [Candidatus Omnitrophota bacterium]